MTNYRFLSTNIVARVVTLKATRRLERSRVIAEFLQFPSHAAPNCCPPADVAIVTFLIGL